VSAGVEVGRFNFRFECQAGCTNCCTQTGHVYLTADDIERLACFAGLPREKFEEKYITRRDTHPRLRMRLGERCYFLLDGGCSVHAAKPLQCRIFPYWPENVDSRASWHRLRKYCPGIGAGALVQIGTVRREAETYREAFPDL
jgi:hypothetical protein